MRTALHGVDRVLHCAARTGPWGPEAEYLAANVRALETLVTSAMAAGVSRVVQVSSITVHGNDVGGQADETGTLRAEANPYSRSKIAGERLLRRMICDAGAPVTIVRPGWIYGPRDQASFGRFAQLAERGRMAMFGSGANHVPLVYVRDVAEGVLLASRVDGAEGRTYLLVNDEPVTQRQYLAAIAEQLGVPPPRRRIPTGWPCWAAPARKAWGGWRGGRSRRRSRGTASSCWAARTASTSAGRGANSASHRRWDWPKASGAAWSGTWVNPGCRKGRW